MVKRGRNKKLPAEQEQRVIQAWRSGRLIKLICFEFGIAAVTVYKILHRHGVDVGKDNKINQLDLFRDV